MMVRVVLRSVVAFFCLFAGWSGGLLNVYAQGASSQGAGIGITPAVIEEPGTPGEVKERTVSVANLSGTEQTYFVYTRDIVGVKDDNSPVYAEDSAELTGYELSAWVALPVSQLTVPAGQSVELPFTLTIPETASPGSHFGAIFISLEPPRLRSTGAAVGYEVANIISIRVAGDAVIDAGIRQFSTNRFLYGSTNVDFTVRIENLGNVLVRPMGPLEITNMFGKQVAQFTFNESEGGVFPKTVREFNFNWKSEGVGFGRYEARVSPSYGEPGSKKTISSTVTFWVLPMNIIIPAIVVLALILGSIYIGVRIYVRRTVALLGYRGERRIVRTVPRYGPPLFLITFIAMLVATVLFLILLLLIFA